MAISKWAAHPVLPAAIAALYLMSWQLPACAQTFEEPQFAFVLRTPSGFSGVKSSAADVSTWKLRNSRSGAALGDNELVSVTVSALARTVDRDPQEEFRDYVRTYATQILHGGTVEELHSARFAGRDGFSAVARGAIKLGADKRPAVARILLMEVDGNHVLVSAIALGNGDRAYAEVGTPNGIFAPIEAKARSLSRRPGETQEAQHAPPAGLVMKAEVTNIDAVQNGPRTPAALTLKQPVFIRSVRTYHWNNGRGAPPGMITLFASDGREVGSWSARGEPGQGGVPNAYWIATVNQTIDSGSYVLRTSNDRTWSTNARANWRGFYAIEYQHVTQSPDISHKRDRDSFAAARAKFDTFMRTRGDGDWVAAVDAARSLANANPQGVENWRLLARIYAAKPADRTVDPASAFDTLERIVVLDPQDAAARMSLAALLIKQNGYQAAVDQIEAALTINPRLATAAVLNDLAQLYAKADLSDRGLAFLANFAERHPVVRSVKLSEARLLKEAGRTAEALLLLRRIANDPKSPGVDADEARTLLDAWL